MPESLNFEWVRRHTYKILQNGEKIGEITPSTREKKKSTVTFEDSFDGNQKIAGERIIDCFIDFYLKPKVVSVPA